jgi:beta-D-xylosidase 4
MLLGTWDLILLLHPVPFSKTREHLIIGQYRLWLPQSDRITSSISADLTHRSLEKPAPAQAALLRKLGETGKPLVVVQLGDQLDDSELLDADWVSGIFWASWPGQDGGPAIMDLIGGKKSPAGRLSITMYPSNYTELVPMTDMSLRPTAQLPGRTYRWYPTPVRPFGYGLHYTTLKPSFRPPHPPRFSIQSLEKKCKHKYPDMCPLPPIHVDVSNTGKRASDYVVLMYVKSNTGPKPYPLKTLAAYTRLHDIKPRQTVKAELAWNLANLARHDEHGNTVLYPGTYSLMIDEPARTTMQLTLTGHKAVLDKWPAPPT